LLSVTNIIIIFAIVNVFLLTQVLYAMKQKGLTIEQIEVIKKLKAIKEKQVKEQSVIKK